MSNNRWLFRPTEDDDGRTDVIHPDGQALCWMPTVAAEILQGAYRSMWERDPVVADEWMVGVMFGMHLALAFGNQLPAIEIGRGEDGVISLRMCDDGRG